MSNYLSISRKRVQIILSLFYVLTQGLGPSLFGIPCYFLIWLPLFMISLIIAKVRYTAAFGCTMVHYLPYSSYGVIRLLPVVRYYDNRLSGSLSLPCLPPSGGSFGFRLSCLVLFIIFSWTELHVPSLKM